MARDQAAETHIMFSYAQPAEKTYCHADAMQIFSFCMAVLSAAILNLFSSNYGAPEEIRTPDPQIRSLSVAAAAAYF